jgi:hypothetical protein
MGLLEDIGNGTLKVADAMGGIFVKSAKTRNGGNAGKLLKLQAERDALKAKLTARELEIKLQDDILQTQGEIDDLKFKLKTKG